MKKYMLLYRGPATPPDASHAGWPEWFEKTGDALAHIGSPMTERSTVHANGTTSTETTSLNGYSIVKADSMDGAVALVKDHPFLALGDAYSIEIYEIPRDE